MKRIEQVSCSLNLGLIYNLEYNYSPDSGTKIKIYFVNEQGRYEQPSLLPLQKVFIRIGGASFTMFPVASGIEMSFGRRVIWVEFEDDFFNLSNYYIVLPGRGCGRNVVTLGSPVDSRDPIVKQNTSLDRIATQIEQLTQFPDYAYSFSDFLAALGSKINYSLQASFDSSVKKDYQGSFLEVLQAWCSFYNLAFFFENGTVKIFNPTTLTINLPTQPADALSYTIEQDVRSTYGKTVCNWFQQEGGQYSLSQSPTDTDGSNNRNSNIQNDPLFIRSLTLYPINNIFNLPQTPVDIKQATAAQYGQNFWFLYNYWLGTTSQNCGWTARNDLSPTLSIVRGVNDIDSSIATFDSEIFEKNFNTYYEYGSKLAGRWYLSDEFSDLAVAQNFTWFGEQNGQIFSNFENADDKILQINYLFDSEDKSIYPPVFPVIQDTILGEGFPGYKYIGDRMAYYDSYELPTGSFQLGSILYEVDLLGKSYLEGTLGYNGMDYSELSADLKGNLNCLAYKNNLQFSEQLINIFKQIEEKSKLLQPRYSSIPIKGLPNTDYRSFKASKKESQDIEIIRSNDGPDVLSNTSVIKTRQEGEYTIYYDKYQTCASANTSDGFYQYRFDSTQISSDNEIGIRFTKQANNTYQITRDYNVIKNLVNPPGFNTLAQARAFPTKRVTYTLNYFQDVPVNFLSQGLVGMSVSIGDNGISASYTFSNEMLQVPDYRPKIEEVQQNIRNSWIRQYQPNRVIV